jgi:endoglycosylceramidase
VAPVSGTLGHSGRWIVDRSGRVIIEHGVNIVDKLKPYEPAALGISADDAAFLAAHGFTAVRLGVILAGVEPAPGVFDDRYIASIESTVGLLARYGIRSLVDFHQDQYNELFQGEGFPSWMVDDNGLPAEPRSTFPADYYTMPALNRAYDNFWENTAGPGGIGLETRYEQAWANVAGRFRGNPAVLGYDVFNEPWPGTVGPSCFGPRGCPSFDETVLGPFEHAVTLAIHAADPTHLAFYEPVQFFAAGAPTYLGKIGDDRSGFTFHMYCLAALGAPETPPTRSTCNGVEQSDIANAIHQGAVSGDALLLSEFGAVNDASELHEVIGLADSSAIPWTEWAYCYCGDPTGQPAQALVDNPKDPPVGANVDIAKLAILDEPYPQAVAGTPGGYSYDGSTDDFTFTYSTARAGGGRFPDGTPTQIFVSPLHYPTGYRVTVSGAHVSSRPGASELLLVADPAASVVHVTIRPS